jgi:hypothetical protein
MNKDFFVHDRFLLFVCSFVIRLQFVHTRDGEYEWEGGLFIIESCSFANG